MPPELRALFASQHLVATSAQIHEILSRGAFQRHLRRGDIVKVWPNIYSLGEPDNRTKLHGLDLRCGEQVAVCLHTAAQVYGFSTEPATALHVLNPPGNRLRDGAGLVVHRRANAPLTELRGRPLTTPAWTAIEVARCVARPRALATLDAALRSGTCTSEDLLVAADQQAGRRHISMVRLLVLLARPGAESPMESEARLVMIDGGLPEPVLQYELVDHDGRCWRVDFAWPEYGVVVEYDGFDWHSSPAHLRRDRQKRAALQELGLTLISIVADDVRCRPEELVRRIGVQLDRAAA